MWIATVSEADWKKEKNILSSVDFDVHGTKTILILTGTSKSIWDLSGNSWSVMIRGLQQTAASIFENKKLQSLCKITAGRTISYYHGESLI